MSLKSLRVLVLGKNGQLARSFAEFSSPTMTFAGRSEIDLANLDQIESRLDQLMSQQSFEVLINTAAYTQVDKAESEMDLANTVNCESVGKITQWCAGKNIFFVGYSTDYVFSGEGDRAWTETDSTAPVNRYGRSKLDGEIKTVESGVNGLIIRTSWLHSPYGKNFVRTMLGLTRSPVRVVSDQFGAPTYAKDLADATLELLEVKVEKLKAVEIFHITNSGVTSWHEFASEIFRRSVAIGIIERGLEVQPILSAEYKTAARRPANSRLSSHKLLNQSNVAMPTWQTGLDNCLERIKELGHGR